MCFLIWKVKRDVYIELPREDDMSLSGNMVGKLDKAMYGTRDAPQIWQRDRGSDDVGVGLQVKYVAPRCLLSC